MPKTTTDPLATEERGSLTFFGTAVNAQYRDGDVVMYVKGEALDDGELHLPRADVVKLRAMLDEAEARFG